MINDDDDDYNENWSSFDPAIKKPNQFNCFIFLSFVNVLDNRSTLGLLYSQTSSFDHVGFWCNFF